MRYILSTLALLPTALWAETIPLSAPVTAATLYSEGATVIRSVPFTAPAGPHDLLITNLPASLDPYSVRVSIDGATLGAVTVRQDRVLPIDTNDSPEFTAARAEVTRLQDKLQSTVDARADVRMRASAAEARIAYLATLSGPTEIAASPETLQATLLLIGSETLAARQEIARATRTARGFDKPLEDLTEELQKARQTVTALEPSQSDTAMLSISITAAAATSGTLTLTHLVQEAAWLPVYDVHLSHGHTASLNLKRGAFVGQDTGEDWHDVALTLSTSRPNDQTQPSKLYAQRRWIEDKQIQTLRKSADAEMSFDGVASLAEPVVAPPAPYATIDDGINATYVYPTPVSIISSEDGLRLSLDTLALDPTVFALANPDRDDTAFVMAAFTNTTDEIILPSYEASYYLNGTFIGAGELPLIAKGDDAELSFGPINGLRLTNTVLNRVSGDSGVLTSRNDISEIRELTIENLTDRDWDLRLLGRVPYSEQEDLTITYQAMPKPTQTDYDGDRGILAWEQALTAGDTLSIRLSHQLQWPGDMVLR